ncbi:MAG: aspartate kinase [Candidatus Paceibacteria bacterium]|jgi:aspartate kinase
MKIGGAGLSDSDSVKRACALPGNFSGETPILVVSAHEGVTAQLQTCANSAAAGALEIEAVRVRHRGLLRDLSLEPELLDRLFTELGQVLYSISERRRLLPEELDFVLSFGERMSARIVSACLRSQGTMATPVDAYDLGLTTDSCHGHARPLPGLEASLQRSLEQIPGVPVVTGFLAKDGSGNLTTLGSNGSDLTASLVARAVGAERLVFWKCVPGVLDADPRIVPEARVLDGVSMVEAAALAFHGASVLHPSTLSPLLDSTVSVEVRDLRNSKEEGTRFDQRPVSTRPIAITGMSNLQGLRIPNQPAELSATLFTLLHAHHVSPRCLHMASDSITLYAPLTPGWEIMRRELGDRAEGLPSLSSVALIGGGGASHCTTLLPELRATGLEPVRTQFDRHGLSQLMLFEPENQAAAIQWLHKELFASLNGSTLA